MLLPFVIIVLCYWRIFAHIRLAKLRLLQTRRGGNGGRAGGGADVRAWTTQAAIVKTIRQIKVVVIIFIAFCICWAPYVVVLLSDEFDLFPLSIHLYASMIAHLHASVNFVIYGLTNKGLRAGYYDFLAHRLCGFDRAVYATDASMTTRSRASGRSFDVARTSRANRKSVARNPASVVINELPDTLLSENVKGATTSMKETICVDCVQTVHEGHHSCDDSDAVDVVLHLASA